MVSAWTVSKVYPRVCGGTPGYPFGSPAVFGLSPRVRGNRLGQGRMLIPEGSIPACAGEPAGGGWPALVGTVYPRVCGGTQHAIDDVGRGEGLSPRVRGNPALASAPAPSARSIPACAGEPRRRILCSAGMGVYPRVCGGTHRFCGRRTRR